MKKSYKITFSAVFAALSSVFMLIGYFPYLTYAVPAVAGLFVMVVFIEIGTPYALGTFAVSSLLNFLLAEKETAVLFFCLFGFYPILKAYIERLKKPFAEWVIKIAVFNVCAVLSYLAVTFVLGIGFEELNSIFKYGVYVFWLACNVVFVLYDIAISRVAAFYVIRLHQRISGVFKK